MILWMGGFILTHPSMAGPSSAAEPLRHGKEALEAGKFDEAERWFRITRRDFPKNTEGTEALVQETFLLVSRELSSLKLASLWREGANWAESVEKSSASAQQKKAKAYESKALEAIGGIRDITPKLLGLSSVALSLNFNVGMEGLEADDIRNRLKKGEWVEEDDASRLERAEFLANYLGFLATIFDHLDDRMFNNPHEGKVRAPVLFNSLGTRLYIANQKKPTTEQSRLAKRCFDRVLELTSGTPYDKQRQEALDFLAKMDAKKSAAATPVKAAAKDWVCPVDGKTMDPNWKFCPFHGAKLGKKKK
ncbi:MAG TPA: hypothetical protein VI895_07080 [Bdellovibrionota bacterium]|nr:hypothetical protein [Bdellovibrionota bacterium]